MAARSYKAEERRCHQGREVGAKPMGGTGCIVEAGIGEVVGNNKSEKKKSEVD